MAWDESDALDSRRQEIMDSDFPVEEKNRLLIALGQDIAGQIQNKLDENRWTIEAFRAAGIDVESYRPSLWYRFVEWLSKRL